MPMACEERGAGMTACPPAPPWDLILFNRLVAIALLITMAANKVGPGAPLFGSREAGEGAISCDTLMLSGSLSRQMAKGLPRPLLN